MLNYSVLTEDKDIQEYVKEMALWLQTNTLLSNEDIYSAFLTDKDRVLRLFVSYPETTFSQDPAKYAELLAISWGVLEETSLEFVEG